MSRFRTDEELEDKARGLRRRLGLEHQQHIDMMTVLQKLKVENQSFGYLRVPDYQMPDAEGQWDSEKKTIRLRESVFQGMQAQHSRARMTVSHEIAHRELGHGGIRNRSLVKSASERFVSEVKREESEAKRFAARILAPAYLIQSSDTAEDIKSKFGLSLEAAAIRREEVNELDRRAAGRPKELPSVVVDFLREAKRRGHNIETDLGD
ncbi:ImmA/IrrE family metallo-endopeptidase [Methylobacterium thuringiense]|nr:ImmA/IrrE family metallo-endopeptidase [Methylobacterium thuringiense]